MHDLVAVVHEDVLLPDGWQQALERSLAKLEAADPDWGLAGSVGWRADGSVVGPYSDPGRYRNLLEPRRFAEVERIDEQLMLLRRSRPVAMDPALPSIHNIGNDLPLTARVQGRRTYVVDAPTIHKSADDKGRPIRCRDDSPKIRSRAGYAWRADRACSDDYLRHKWPSVSLPAIAEPPHVPVAADASCDPPVVLLARGGGGSRLLEALAADAGVFTGARRNSAGDALGLVIAVYKCVLNRYHGHPPWQRAAGIEELRDDGAALARDAPAGAPWGFKLPEAMLVPDEVLQAFPQARFLHMVRDPLATCLRRTHMTSRLDNQIGQAVLPAAYRHCGRPVDAVLDDAPEMRMAVGTRHQLECALDFLERLPPGRCLQVRFEDLLVDPIAAVGPVSAWIHGHDVPVPADPRVHREADPARAAREGSNVAPGVEREIRTLLAPLRHRLGYTDEG
jgi:hypothetical protein